VVVKSVQGTNLLANKSCFAAVQATTKKETNEMKT
jgi:hypothetical protein